MATMFPEELPSRIRKDPKRSAEISFYDNLRWQLPDDWFVFYSVAWLGLTSYGAAPRDGETDFIVAHPVEGVLLIEVKGGRIHYDPIAGQWFSTDREGHVHPISPFAQVKQCKYALLEKVKSIPSWSHKWITLGHAVAFPDAVLSSGPLPLEAPTDIIIDANALPNLFERIRAVLAYWRGEEPKPFTEGAALVKDLTNLLAPKTVLRNPLSVQVAEEQRVIIRLTEEQYRILDLLSRTRRAAISGCAGSGKTMLAVEKARRLASEGFRVLLTCRSETLADHLSQAAEGVSVYAFAQLCRFMAEEAKLPIPDETNDAALADALSSAVRGHYDRQFDAIIVDEGQDFPDIWWLSLEDCLRERAESIFYVFYDDNQRVYGTEAAIPSDLPVFTMGENVRNTRAIHQTLRPYYEGPSGSIARGPAGRSVETISYQTEGELIRLLSRTLHRLIVTEGIPLPDIVVLTPKAPEEAGLNGALLDSGYRLTEHPDARRREILCTSVADFKGLERPVVILAGLDRFLLMETARRNAVCYVAFSRPRNHLILMGQPEALAALQPPSEGHSHAL